MAHHSVILWTSESLFWRFEKLTIFWGCILISILNKIQKAKPKKKNGMHFVILVTIWSLDSRKKFLIRPFKILSFYYSWKFGQYLEVFEDKQVQGRWPEGSLPKGLALWWAAICNNKIFKILKLLYLFNRLLEFFSCTVIFGWNPIFRANPHSNVTS